MSPAAATWLVSLLTGTLATSIALIAVASLGFAMLIGRISIREGARVVAGCFILFGAGSLASGLVALARASGSASPATTPQAAPPPPVPPSTPPAFDPYAGASVPN